ncbi:MAG: hypothetical protein MUE91_02060 [Ignavibacteriaceae bacterium]|jgi:hypothetical protein|nr:hypothetical protein [Ignavibacteriaceae bacterium]MCU0405672.1 hypothetical protein [Ignavibacteriaceae bacterium]MCU0413178.1 hypothetical protein [Ignavibacteriaceae bacterium]
MGGKVSLLLVMLFSGIMALFSGKIMDRNVEMTENYVDYYSDTRASNIAISAANIAINKLYLDKNWMTGISNRSFADGYMNVDIDTLGWDSRKITATGEYRGITKTVEILLEPENFALFGNFYNVFGSVWAATGDTFSGRFHANDWINCYGDPVFLGPATTSKGVKLYDKFSNPEFFGGTKVTDPIPLQFDTSAIRIAAYNNGRIFRDTTNTGKVTTVDLTFLANGNVTYRLKIGSGSYTPLITVPLTTLAPNGVIFVEKGNINVEGTLNGRTTIVASQKGSSSAGQVFITNSIDYAQNPLTNPSSTDMMGIVAENKVTVTYDPARGDINIYSSIFSQKDGLVIERYADYPTAYKMNLLGGIIGQKIQPTAKYKLINGKYVPINGYSYVHKYDDRMLKVRPPYFPATKYYRVISWYED